jgi:hypothetical protein
MTSIFLRPVTGVTRSLARRRRKHPCGDRRNCQTPPSLAHWRLFTEDIVPFKRQFLSRASKGKEFQQHFWDCLFAVRRGQWRSTADFVLTDE